MARHGSTGRETRPLFLLGFVQYSLLLILLKTVRMPTANIAIRNSITAAALLATPRETCPTPAWVPKISKTDITRIVTATITTKNLSTTRVHTAKLAVLRWIYGCLPTHKPPDKFPVYEISGERHHRTHAPCATSSEVSVSRCRLEMTTHMR